jgi:hypothetical protein
MLLAVFVRIEGFATVTIPRGSFRWLKHRSDARAFHHFAHPTCMRGDKELKCVRWYDMENVLIFWNP